MTESDTILLVEDNPDDEALTGRAFHKAGLTNVVEVVRDGAAALERLIGAGSESPALPRVVLLDLKLPKIDGLEVLRRLRENDRTRYLPIVILTSSDLEEDMLRSYEYGANSYVRKPVEFSQFCDAVAKLGLYWYLVNARPKERG
jgi:two-component system, response regulator